MAISCVSKTDEAFSNLPQKEAVEVRVIAAQKEEIAQELVYSGLIEPKDDVPLSFSVPGTIVSVKVEEGTPVKKGELLAKLDNTSYQNAYESALATLQQARDAYNRLKKVHEQGSLPDMDWEEVKAKLAQAEAAAAIAKRNLANTEIRAPFSGVIGARNIEPGSHATPGLTALRLITFGQVYARVSVPEDEITKIKKSQKAIVNVPAINERLEGKVEQVGVIANTISKTFEVKVLLQNSEDTMRPGMVCDVIIPLETGETAMLLPLKAVMKDVNETHYVFVLNGDRVEQRSVEIDGIVNNKLRIVAGIEEGEEVVTEGQMKLSEHSKVVVNRELASLHN